MKTVNGAILLQTGRAARERIRDAERRLVEAEALFERAKEDVEIELLLADLPGRVCAASQNGDDALHVLGFGGARSVVQHEADKSRLQQAVETWAAENGLVVRYDWTNDGDGGGWQLLYLSWREAQ